MKRIALRVKLKLQAVVSWLSASKKRKRLAGFAGIIMIALAGQIIYSSFAATTEYSQIPEVARMQKLTEEVIKLTDEYASMPDTVSGKKAANQPNELKSGKANEIIAKAKERKEAYRLAMRLDPQTTANSFLPYSTRDKLPSGTYELLERVRIVKGTWTTWLVSLDHGGEDAAKKEKISATITEAGDVDTFVYSNNLPQLQSGTEVATLGIAIDDSVIMTLPGTQSSQSSNNPVSSLIKPHRVSAQVITIDPVPAERICIIPEIADFITGFIPGDIYEDAARGCRERLSEAVNKVFCEDSEECLSNINKPIDLTGDNGKRKTLIVPIQFEGDALPLSRDDLSEGYQKVTSTYHRMSYGKFGPQYDVWERWEATSANNDFEECNSVNLPDRQSAYGRISRNIINANEKLKNAIEQGDYTDVMYVFSSMNCDNGTVGASGWAAIGLNRGGGYIAASTILLDDYYSDGNNQGFFIITLIHELGHSYGLGHANGACNDGAPTDDPEELDLSKYCTAEFAEYANDNDPMGNPNDPDKVDLGFASKLRLGWVDNDDYIELPEEGGQYTINALHRGEGTRSIKIRYGDRDLFIDYRQGDGLFNYFANNDASTNLMGSTHDEIMTPEGELTGDYYWSYSQAGQKEAYRIGSGEDVICVTPSNMSNQSVDISVHIGESCPEYEAELHSSGDEVLSDSPVSYWRFNEATESLARDETRNHDGTISRAATTIIPGPQGGDSAFNFVGSSFVDIGNQADLSTPEWTIEAWIRPDGSNDRSYVYRNRFYGWGMMITGGVLSAYSHNCTEPCSRESSTSSVVFEGLQLGSWQHTALVKDRTSLTLYVNGVAVDSKPADTNTYYITGGGTSIGRDAGCSCRYYRGGIDEVAFFNRPISSDRIKAHMSRQGSKIDYKNIQY